ncbi:hypothetical protein B0T14DRAFT_525774 [Immersiella caudata]|uniref:Uncharacterized protein n=1 Tax=Immersiella caudata TaxID=314043 RepID=A0AA39WLV7_9PEZI|nr:hypothetical protein B0T14DRAFT_525774 [Immersiella caudata]
MVTGCPSEFVYSPVLSFSSKAQQVVHCNIHISNPPPLTPTLNPSSITSSTLTKPPHKDKRQTHNNDIEAPILVVAAVDLETGRTARSAAPGFNVGGALGVEVGAEHGGGSGQDGGQDREGEERKGGGEDVADHFRDAIFRIPDLMIEIGNIGVAAMVARVPLLVWRVWLIRKRGKMCDEERKGFLNQGRAAEILGDLGRGGEFGMIWFCRCEVNTPDSLHWSLFYDGMEPQEERLLACSECSREVIVPSVPTGH